MHRQTVTGGKRSEQESAMARPAASRPAGGAAASLLRLQRQVGNRAVVKLVQRHCYEQFDSLAEARDANIYSRTLLTLQERHRIVDHESKRFTDGERDNVLKQNMEAYGRLTDDATGKRLERQDMSVAPHVDHRYPKASGGTNSFKNARVIAAGANLTKGSKTTRHLEEGEQNDDVLAQEPTKALKPYRDLDDSEFTIYRYGLFSADQKALILQANEDYYGTLTSDTTGEELERADPRRIAQVDHILDKGSGGCSFYFNAQVISSSSNASKSGLRGADEEREEKSDYDRGTTTLRQYFEGRPASKKRKEPEPKSPPSSRTRSRTKGKDEGTGTTNKKRRLV